MKKLLYALVLGIALGAVSWFVVPLVSDKFEPFDSDMGFWIGQALMITGAFYFGFIHGGGSNAVFIIGAYIGLNLYPYLFGGSDHRAWAALGLFTTTIFCVLPLGVGLVGVIVGRAKRRGE